MTDIRVIAAVVDKTQLTLYREDGSTYNIPQGDKRLLPILNEVTPIIEAGLVATIQIHEPSEIRDTTYADYEKKAGGFTKFFRVLKHKVTSLLLGDELDEPVMHINPVSVGSVPGTKMQSAIADIMVHAQPVSDPAYNERDTTDQHTIVAVVEDAGGNKTAVPGVENIKRQIAHATKFDNTKGMEAFLARLGAAIGKRGHTVDDVLRFMERGDLPLADDGTIIAYKVLTTNGKGPEATEFYDCHTRKVKQRVGSFVQQDEKLIDPSRRTECSSGLHIARRGYLGGFRGDIIVMVKIRPEDVIAVPHGEPDKVRVSGYHIIAKIPSTEHAALRSNTAMQGTNALKLLTMAIAGDHIGVTEYVTINGASGSKVVITPVEGANTAKPQIKKETPITPAVPDPVKPNEPVLDGPIVDPKKLAADLTEQRAAKPSAPTKADQARVLFTANKIDELKAFKKAAKKSWEVLGFTSEEITLIMSENNGSPVTNGQPAVAPEPLPVIPEVRDAKDGGYTTSPAPHPDIPHVPNKKTVKALREASAPSAKELKMSGTRAEVARQLFNDAVAGDKSRWGSLWRHQKECKKSWAILGFNAKETDRIKVNKPDWA